MLKLAIAGLVFALFAKMFRTDPNVPSFAFDKKFPVSNGPAYQYEVVLDKNATALSELEARGLETLNMDPLFRCGAGLFGVRWIGKSIYALNDKDSPFWNKFLLRVYKLVLEDASPPDENKFIVRHQVLGRKVPMSMRYDEFTCAKPKETPCSKWNAVGYVAPRITERLTKGATSDPHYYQKLTVLANYGFKTPKTCPFVKEAWWCLWIFCPVN